MRIIKSHLSLKPLRRFFYALSFSAVRRFFLRKFPFTLKLPSKFIDRRSGKVKGRPAPGMTRFGIAPPALRVRSLSAFGH